MRITASAKRLPKQILAQPVPLPAPVGGWDAISPLANMPVDRAVQLDNWVCRPGWIEPRPGYILQSTGLAGPVQTLMAYNGIDGTRKLFGVAESIIYDCSLADGSSNPVVTTLSSPRMQYVMFANPSVSEYLIAVNGQDNPWAFDGTNWTQPVIQIGYASGSIIWSQNMVPNETIVLNGTVITFVTGVPTGNQVQIGSSLAVTLASLLTFLQASADPNITQFTYSTSFNTTLNLSAAVSGTSGNDLTIEAGYATGTITFSVNPSEGDTVTLNGTVVTFVTPVAYVEATAVFTESGTNNFLVGDTLSIGNQNFTIVSPIGTAPGNILVQADTNAGYALTMEAIIASMAAAGPGAVPTSTYVPNTTVSTVSGSLTAGNGATSGQTCIFTSLLPGAYGNYAPSLYTASGTSAGSFGGTLFAGGIDGITAVGNQVAISSTLANTLSSFLSFTTNSLDAGVQSFTYAVTSTAINLTSATVGILGNILTIQASAATTSGPTLVGGSTAAESGTTLTNGGDDYGLIPSQFIQVNSYMNRLWFVPSNSTNVVYMQTIGGISGPASVFPLGQLIKKGGYIMAIGTWTVDTRQNVDEYIAFITSRGEIIVYQGTDPSTPGTFALTGIYQVGAPIGRRCFLRITGDLQIITVDGLIGMSEMLSTDRAAANRVSLTSIIMNQMNLAAQTYKNNFGWQVIEFPLGTLVILNIPIQENQFQMQFVMNTITGAWSRFVGITPSGNQNASYGINANCWEVDAFDNIYFGGNDGNVYQWFVGSGDYGKPITSVVETAYNSFGNGAQLKRYTMLQPLITTTGYPIPSIGINVDFNNTNILSTQQPVFSQIPLWDAITWDQFNWPGSPVTTDNWTSVQGIGHYVSIALQISTTPSATNSTYITPLQVNGFNIVAESGAFV